MTLVSTRLPLSTPAAFSASPTSVPACISRRMMSPVDTWTKFGADAVGELAKCPPTSRLLTVPLPPPGGPSSTSACIGDEAADCVCLGTLLVYAPAVPGAFEVEAGRLDSASRAAPAPAPALYMRHVVVAAVASSVITKVVWQIVVFLLQRTPDGSR